MRRTALVFVTALLAFAGLAAPAQAVGISYPTPTLLADINANARFDELQGATPFNGALYYSGYSPESGYELRRINSAGISELVEDINPAGDSSPYAMAVFQNKLYFIASNSEGVRYLYSITSSGSLVEHIVIGLNYGYGSSDQLAVYNSNLYFYRFNGSSEDAGWELWQTDGSSFSTTAIPTHDPQEYMSSFTLEVINNKLYFSMPITYTTGTTGIGVIGTNGIATVAPNTGSFVSPHEITKLGNRMAFIADGPSGREVYVYDGTNTPVAMNVAPDTNSVQNSYPSSLFVFKDKLYFSASTQNGGVYEFWRTDGVAQPTRFTGSLFPVGGSINPMSIGVLNGRLYFSAQTVTDDPYDYRRSLYSTDGSIIRAEAAASSVIATYDSKQRVFNEKMYVTANVGTGFRLYSFDGLSLTEVENSDFSTADGYSEPWTKSAFAVTSDALYFAGYAGQTSGMYKYDGSGTPTMVPGSLDLSIATITNLGDTVYVVAQPASYIYQNLFVYTINQSGVLVKLDDVSDALGINNIELITPMRDGTLFVEYQTAAFVSNGTLHSMDTSNLTDIQTGVVSNGNYYFFAVTGNRNVVFRWDGLNAPVEFVDLGLWNWNIPQLFLVDGEINCIWDFGDGTALHRITSDGAVLVDYELAITSTYINETLQMGSSTYLIAYNNGAGMRQVWKATSSGLTLMSDVNAQVTVMFSLSEALGRLVVSGFGTSGSVIAAVVEASGNVSTIMDTGVYESENIYGRVAGFEGDYYFPYNHPQFGLELATTGSGVSAVAPSAPSNLAVGVGTDSTVALTWEAPLNTGGQPLSTYVVEYTTNGSTWTNFYHPASTQTSIVVTGLKFSTNYQFRVKARTLEGNSAATSSVSKKTTVVKPGKVRSLAVAAKGIAKTSAKVSWLAPSVQGSGGIKDYKIETSLNGKKWTVVKDAVSKVAAITLTKLKGKTKYYVRVTAIAFSGSGPVSSKVLFKTK